MQGGGHDNLYHAITGEATIQAPCGEHNACIGKYCTAVSVGHSGSAPEQHARAPERVVHATYSVSRSPCRPWPTA